MRSEKINENDLHFSSKNREEYLRRIHKVQDYIEQHIGQAMSIEDLANTTGFQNIILVVFFKVCYMSHLLNMLIESA